MAVFGLMLVALFRALVSERKLAQHAADDDPADAPGPAGFRAPISSLFTTPAVVFAYIGGGLQMFTAGVLLAWLPSFFNRSYGLALDKAGAMASIFVLLVGSGMVVCGIITDRVSRNDPARKWTTAVVFGVISLVFLGAGFQLPTGTSQLVLIGIGAFFSAGSSGPIAAMVANLTHSSVRASAFGTLTLANNLLGLALGPFVVGVLADRFGLVTALQIAPLIYIVAIVALILGKRAYPAGRRKLAALTTAPA